MPCLIATGFPKFRTVSSFPGCWFLTLAVFWLGLGSGTAGGGGETVKAANSAGASSDRDRVEVQAAIDRGVTWLLANQNSNGYWSTPDQPAVTALVLTALNKEPSRRFVGRRPSEISQAYEFLLGSARPDGSIYRLGYANYNTSLALVALSTAEDPRFAPVIRNARRYLATTQIDMGEPGVADTPFDGGVGYGSKYQHSDLNNTLAAIEAMRASEPALRADLPNGGRLESDLDWGAVVSFLRNCQNLPGTNSADWVSSDPKDRGGFVYYPGQSMAGGVTNPVTGRVALRSYGSISYAGLLSYIYARVDASDARVAAVVDWLRTNYTVEENPGMGAQGLYYYLHLMTKALTAARIDRIRLADGREVSWRDDVRKKLLESQRSDGSWVNAHPRWWESDRALVTAYALLTLEMLNAMEGG